MSDLSKSIFDLWTLADTKVWPDGAPTIVLGGWWYAHATYELHGPYISYDTNLDDTNFDDEQYAQLDAALWRIVQFVAWSVKRQREISDYYHPERIPWNGNVLVWFFAEPSQWISAAREIVESFADKENV